MTRIRIENVVASTSLGEHLDLPRIALSLDGAEYEPKAFPGLIYRMKQPKAAILLFSSGKVVCTGGKSWKQVDQAVRAISELVRKSGQKILANPKIEIQNIVATSNLEAEVNLNSVAVSFGLDRVEYEPEQFPGLVYRIDDPRVVILLFGSGKVVCTGARKPSDILQAVEIVKGELSRAGILRRQQNPVAPPPEPSFAKSRPARTLPAREFQASPALPEPVGAPAA